MQIYKKFIFRGIEVQFFTRTAVEFELYGVDEVIGDVAEDGFFWDILADKFVSVFDQPLLPGGIRMCEKYPGIQFSGDTLVVGEFGSVVRSDSMHHRLVGQQQVDDSVSHSLGVLSLRGACHHGEAGETFREHHDGVDAVAPHNGVQLPVPEAPAAVHNFRPFLNSDSVAYRDEFPDRSSPVLSPVPQVFV